MRLILEEFTDRNGTIILIQCFLINSCQVSTRSLQVGNGQDWISQKRQICSSVNTVSLECVANLVSNDKS